MAKHVATRSDYVQSEQFNLIKKAVSTITCLEDLVNIALAKIKTLYSCQVLPHVI